MKSVTNNNIYTTKLFIPYTTKSSSIRVSNLLDAKWLEFDLTKNNNNITSLKFNTDQEIVVGNTDIRVSKSYISNMMMHNGEEYNGEMFVADLKRNNEILEKEEKENTEE